MSERLLVFDFLSCWGTIEFCVIVVVFILLLISNLLERILCLALWSMFKVILSSAVAAASRSWIGTWSSPVSHAVASVASIFWGKRSSELPSKSCVPLVGASDCACGKVARVPFYSLTGSFILLFLLNPASALLPASALSSSSANSSDR